MTSLPIEKQVCSLDLAKRLRDLGVKQESLWRWIDENLISVRQRGEYPTAWVSGIAAFTVSELGEMLPEEVEVNEKDYYLSFQRTLGNQWETSYRNSVRAALYQSADTEADARAAMLVYLLENGLLKL